MHNIICWHSHLRHLFFTLPTLLVMAASAMAAEPRHRVAPLQFPSDNIVPVIAWDVVADYSADPEGRQDSTEAFKSALDAAKKMGGTVFAPAGRYLIQGNLTIPSGVTLRGDWRQPTPEQPAVAGTVLLAVAGRGSSEGEPFIDAEDGGSVQDLTIFYPEQKVNGIEPYPVCIRLKRNSTARNINLINPYVGLVTSHFSTVFNVCGSPLKTGIVMLQAGAVPRCNNIQFSPRFWSGSGLPDAPTAEQLRSTIAGLKGYAIQLNRQDAGIFINVLIDGYPTGIKFMPPHGWTYWNNLHIKDAEVGIHFTGGSHQRAAFTASSIEARRNCVLFQMDQSEWKLEEWDKMKLSKSGAPNGTPKDKGDLWIFGCRFETDGTAILLDGSFPQKVDLQDCSFDRWGGGEQDFAIDATDGSVEIYDSEFKQNNRHVKSSGKRSQVTAKGNVFAGSPDLQVANGAEVDHKSISEVKSSLRPLAPVPSRLPSRTGADSLYVVTQAPYNAPSDGNGDATDAIQKALETAGKEGGGTVYLPQGRYRLTRHLSVPPGVELRGINDAMPQPLSGRTMLIADLPDDRGKPDNPPLISLQSSPSAGGSGIAGLMIWYLHQDYRDIQPYPWTIRGLGPGCWAQRLYFGNIYNGVDFATNDSDQHVLTRVNGSALNTAFFVGNSAKIGWIDNCHIRPQDWSLSSSKKNILEFPGDNFNKPTLQNVFRGTEFSLIPNMRGAGTVTVGSGANEQITGFFTNGSTRTFDFIDHNGTGGGNADVLIGGSEAGWGTWVKALGDRGVTFVNFSFNPMTRLPYTKAEDISEANLPKGMVMRVNRDVPADRNINFIISTFYGRDQVDYGFDLQGGNLSFKQVEQVHSYAKGAIKLDGGKFTERNINMGDIDASE